MAMKQSSQKPSPSASKGQAAKQAPAPKPAGKAGQQGKKGK